MAINTDDILRVTAEMSFGTDLVQNVFITKCLDDNSLPVAALQADITDWVDDMYNFIVANMTNDITFDIIRAFNVTDDAPEFENLWPTLSAGLATARMLPSGVTALVTALTAFKNVRGRKFLPPFAETNYEEHQWIVGTLGSMLNFGNFWIIAFVGSNGSTWQAGVLDKFGIYRQFEEVLARPIAAYQRRRKEGVGA